jgi:hypothetical protein
LILDEASESFQAVLIECGSDPAIVRSGCDRAGLSTELQQSRDTRHVDFEPACDLATLAFMMIDGRHDPFPEIVR